MTVKNDIKAIIIGSGWTMSKVVRELNRKHGRRGTIQNLSNKLSRGTLRYTEAVDIAEVMGMAISWEKKAGDR